MHGDSQLPQKLLITTSADQTIKLWKLDFENKDRRPVPHVLYEHQEEITSAHCSPQSDAYLLASVDIAGWVLVRDLRDPERVLSRFRPDVTDAGSNVQQGSFPIGNVCFNFPLLSKDDALYEQKLFVSLNNHLFIYSILTVKNRRAGTDELQVSLVT